MPVCSILTIYLISSELVFQLPDVYVRGEGDLLLLASDTFVIIL